MKPTNNRRIILKTMLASAGVTTASGAMPAKWQKPLIEAVLLPAHAATTDDLETVPCETMSFTGGVIMEITDGAPNDTTITAELCIQKACDSDTVDVQIEVKYELPYRIYYPWFSQTGIPIDSEQELNPPTMILDCIPDGDSTKPVVSITISSVGETVVGSMSYTGTDLPVEAVGSFELNQGDCQLGGPRDCVD